MEVINIYPISNEYKTHIDSSFSRSSKSKIVIDGIEYLDNVIMSNPTFSHENEVFIGGFPSKTSSFEIRDEDGTLDLKDKWITVYRGLFIDGDTEWIPMGIFRAINSEDITTNKSKKTIAFKGYDKRQLLDTPYVSNLDWTTSHTGLEIVQEVCANCGLALESTTFNFANYTFTQKPNFPSNTTNTEVISRMAEIGGEIALITREGKVHIKGPTATDVIIPKKKRTTLIKENVFGPITMLVLGHEGYDDDIIYGTEGTEWRIEDNPYVDLIRETIIEDIAPFIIGRSLIPFEIQETIDDFYLDLNDSIGIVDNDGNTFTTNILGYNTTSRVKSTVKASVQDETLSNYEIAGSTKQSLANVSLKVNHNEKQITSLVTKTETIEKNVADLDKSISYFSVDLSQYAITIPTNSSKKPLTTKQYIVNFYGYYKGEQVTPTVTVNGSYGGITVTKDNTSIKFSVNTSTAITNELNEYTVVFTYGTDVVTKKIELALSVAGANGQNGQNGSDGQDGKSAYQIWLDEGNTGSEEDYLASLKGEDGKDGVSTYTHIKYSANADGTSFTSNPTSTTKYMGIAVTTSQTAPTVKTAYSWSEIKGEDGTNGANGKDGADGKTYYTWIKYADTPSSGMSDTPDGKKYMGIAYNKTTSTESSNYGDYAWSLIKGTDGTNGQDGDDGVSSYIHIRYSANSDGSSMTSSPNSSTQYLGTATTNSSTAPTSNTSYTWVKIKGEQGLQGLQGEKGEQGVAGPKGDNGATSYFHIKYSSVANPTSSSQMTETPNTYIGTYVDFTQNDSTDPSKYTWSQFEGSQGAKGEQGIAGTNGINGETSYLHIAYATNSTGTSGFSVSDSINKTYIGQYTDFIQEDSTDPTKYSWTKIKGEDGAKGDKGDKGEQGIQGPKGSDGTSTYFFVRYSANANGSSMTTTPTSTTKYMGVVSTTSSTAPTSYTAYTWSAIKGTDGAKGDKGDTGSPGAKGEDGQSSYLHIKYSDDGTTFTANDGETVGRYRGELVDFVEQDSTVFSDYKWYDMGLIVDEELEEIRTEIVTNTTQINQTTEQIVSSALQEYVRTNDFETLKQTLETSITQTHEDITFNFNTLTQIINNMDSDVQGQFQEINKYIRFNDGGMSFGELNYDVTLRLESDVIYFSVAGVSVMNITPNGIEIDSAKFRYKAEVGNFAFVQEEDGSFSLVKV